MAQKEGTRGKDAASSSILEMSSVQLAFLCYLSQAHSRSYRIFWHCAHLFSPRTGVDFNSLQRRDCGISLISFKC